MKTKTARLSLVGILIGLLIATACQGGTGPSDAASEAPSGREPDASVRGTVTYRERLALTPGASLVVELRDVSHIDGAAPLIARQTISDPGPVPIEFEVHYSRQDINSGNTYGINARIIEADGRLAFANDTAYDVITRGNPDRVEMLLVLVEPPPDLLGDLESGEEWRPWVETPVPVVRANLAPDEPEPYLRIVYLQSTMEGCALPGNQELHLDGHDIIARVTLMQPPSTPWGIPCHEEVVELDTIEAIGEPLEPGQTYRVIVNDRETTTFTLPDPDLPHTVIAESPIERMQVVSPESTPIRYQLRVVSGMPRGSGCSRFNGYEIQRKAANRTFVVVTHHEVADPQVICTADYPVIETIVPLGSDFEPGEQYTVSVNSEAAVTFTARQ